jgi:hypothetical protein
MRASITTSLTPLWRTTAFPKTADLPQDSAENGYQATGAVQNLHCVASPPPHDVATPSLLALPGKRASTQHHAEHTARRLEKMAWLSQAANGRQGAHLLHAQSALSHVKGLLRNGSNALHDAQLPAHKALALQDKTHYCVQTAALQAVSKAQIPAKVERDEDGRQVTKVSLAHYAMFAEPTLRFLGYGNCTLQACAAYSYLKRHLPPDTAVDICEVHNVDHVLVVIGRRPGSDPSDMDDWGPDAVVCDPWAGLSYPLSQYRDMQRPERDVKRHVGESNGHYLGGRLQVMQGVVRLN